MLILACSLAGVLGFVWIGVQSTAGILVFNAAFGFASGASCTCTCTPPPHAFTTFHIPQVDT